MNDAIYQAIAGLRGTVEYADYLMVRCPFHGGAKPNMMISKRRDRPWCLGEQRSYDALDTYQALLTAPVIEVEHPEYPSEVVPVREGSWVAIELRRRNIHNWTRLAMSRNGEVLAFLDAHGEPQVYRFEGIGYRTVGKELTWSQQDRSRNTFLGSLVVYGMLDAAVCVPACDSLGLLCVTPTRGQTADVRLFQDLPAPIWVWPDQREEPSAYKLLTKLAWKAGGIIHPVDGCKDPSEVSIHYGLDWLTPYLASYTLLSWRYVDEQDEANQTQQPGLVVAEGI